MSLLILFLFVTPKQTQGLEHSRNLCPFISFCYKFCCQGRTSNMRALFLSCCIIILSVISVLQHPSFQRLNCNYQFSFNVTNTDGSEVETVSIGQLVQVNISYNGNCTLFPIQLYLEDAWGLDVSSPIVSNSGPVGQIGGLSNGFNLSLGNQTAFAMWPIDRSTWQRHNTSVFFTRDAISLVETPWLDGIRLMVARTLLSDLTCHKTSSSSSGITINCTLTPEILNRTMTLYNATLYYRIGVFNSSLPLGDLNITGATARDYQLNLASITQGPLPIRIHVWISYDTYRTLSDVPNYPQRNYLSANINQSSGGILTFKDRSHPCISSSVHCDYTSNPHELYNPYWLDAMDHTGDDASLMMVLDPYNATDVFTKAFVVDADTDYVITFYLLNILSDTKNGFFSGVPNLTLRVNFSRDEGTVSHLTFPMGELPSFHHPIWQHFTFTVHTDTNVTGMTLTLYDDCQTISGNDFAIDDVSIRKLKFAGVFLTDSPLRAVVGSNVYTRINCSSSTSCSLPIHDLNVKDGSRVTLTLSYFGWSQNRVVTCVATDPSDIIGRQENKNATGITLTQTLNNLGVVMMRSRSSFNISVDGMSLSGIRVNSTSRGLNLVVKTVNVNVTSQNLKEMIPAETEANVLLSTTNTSLSSDTLYSDVIGLSVMLPDGSEISVKNLQHPIRLVVGVLPLPSNDSYRCQFFNESDNQWIDQNVTTTIYQNGTVECSTDHLTSFSVGSISKQVANITQSEAETKNVLIAVIVGPAAGGALLLIIVPLTVLFIILRRRKRARYATEMEMGLKGQEYEKKSIRVGEQIAGRVYLGHPDTGSTVALKRKSHEDPTKYQRELNAYLNMRHPHIVQFLGTYSDDHEYIVLGYASLGSLSDLVKKGYSCQQLHQTMIDVCSAMRYMEEMQMVLCSLSACCVLVWQEGEEMRGKVSSFGSCRGAGQMSESDVQELAVRWTAPELLAEGRCTSKMSDMEVEERVREGIYPPPSDHWSAPFDQVYRECTKECGNRGSFALIFNMLQKEEKRERTAREVYFDGDLYQADPQITTNTNNTGRNDRSDLGHLSGASFVLFAPNISFPRRRHGSSMRVVYLFICHFYTTDGCLSNVNKKFCLITHPSQVSGSWLDATDHRMDTQTLDMSPNTDYVITFYLLNVGAINTTEKVTNVTHQLFDDNLYHGNTTVATNANSIDGARDLLSHGLHPTMRCIENGNRGNFKVLSQMLRKEEGRETIAREDYLNDNLYNANTQITTN
ncbi:putative cAMP-dependent protein kinase catalytic subunit [Planoprotostelium fungivorum]|uniref:Putative cAMP-dependent protein kinase catalytic subunit n=1 Tax=Planoprotostelium fungivorum TaxID=1890364 RepID=A0A2P6NTE5_9EUKA|nr:putative cAMP-dependent protein kinase catalytic subunit [Planoprotostelium fungivorum]